VEKERRGESVVLRVMFGVFIFARDYIRSDKERKTGENQLFCSSSALSFLILVVPRFRSVNHRFIEVEGQSRQF